MLEKNIDGKLHWTHITYLYREFDALIASVKAMMLASFITFVVVILLTVWDAHIRTIFSLCNVWGMIFTGVVVLTIMGFYFWGWANGGVHEREYFMDENGLECRRIVHKAWRMKLLRAIAWILLLTPGKVSQKMLIRRLVFDNDKPINIDFALLSSVSGDEAKGKISITAGEESTEIFVPREYYADVMSFISSCRGR